MTTTQAILYAEDNQNDIELTLSALSECNLENRIDVVNNGIEVIDYLMYKGKFKNREKENPILILLDIKMPKMDGIEVLKIVKNDEKLKHIPIVMLTSSSLEKDLTESYNLGVNAYVVKPIDFNEFLFTVKELGFFWAMINRIPDAK